MGSGSVEGLGCPGEGKFGRTKVKTSWCFVVVRVTCSVGTVVVLGSAVAIGGISVGLGW